MQIEAIGLFSRGGIARPGTAIVNGEARNGIVVIGITANTAGLRSETGDIAWYAVLTGETALSFTVGSASITEAGLSVK